jgi:hypothetical protein
MRLPLAMGAVVVGTPTTPHTPLSGQTSPVRAVVPIGFLDCVCIVTIASSQGRFFAFDTLTHRGEDSARWRFPYALSESRRTLEQKICSVGTYSCDSPVK